jgi:DNA-directed RNA polymerase specialized sigma subunit
MRRMHRAGLRLDDAALAAAIAENMLIRERNQMIEQARVFGMTVRQIAVMFGISKTHVCRVSLRSRGDGTADKDTMQPPKV